MLTNIELVNFCKDKAVHVSSAYMWGDYGRTITKSNIDAKAKQYPSRYRAALNKSLYSLCNGYWIGCDCVGLIKWFLWTECGRHDIRYDRSSDLNVTGFKAKCSIRGKIKHFPGVRGLLLFMTGHVGVYIGNGKVVECTLGSRGDGIVITDINAAAWTEWGYLDLIKYPTVNSISDIKVGDLVRFKGGLHYSNGYVSTGYAASPGVAKVTHVKPTYKHPYHIIHTDNKSNVYGWVDKKDVDKV